MSTPQPILSLAFSLLDDLYALTRKVIVLAPILSFLWFIGNDNLRDFTREFTGINADVAGLRLMLEEQNAAATAERAEVKDALNGLQADLGDAFLRLADLEPSQKIVEYDTSRSRVFGPCKRGDPCPYIFRARRTETGLKCQQPTGQAWILDAAANAVPTAFTATTSFVQLNDDFAVLRGSFIVPRTIQTGASEFFIALRYRGCNEDAPGEVQEETTIILPFTITE